jgi:hypothetical protein
MLPCLLPSDSTLTGIAVDQIQRLLPKARVIYSR